MNNFRFALGAIALAVATSSFAAPKTGSYTFSSPTSTTGATDWAYAASGYNATTGTNYGNSLTYAGSPSFGVPVTVSAWASTGGVGGYTGTLERGYVSRYSSNGSSLNELAITSQPGTGNTSELVYGGGLAAPNSSSADPQHAIDNNGSYESMLFNFGSAVVLNSITIGFPSANSSLDSDATILAYVGKGSPIGTLTSQTYAGLLTNGWVIAGNLSNLAKTGTGTLATTLSSQYWMVGAYMDIGGNGAAMINDGRDYFKISGLAATTGLVTTSAVPEPGEVALFGIAAAAMLAARRRRMRTA